MSATTGMKPVNLTTNSAQENVDYSNTVLSNSANPLISDVSHELRTPLTSIRGALGLLESGKLDSQSEQGKRLLEIAINNTDRLVRFTKTLEDSTRVLTEFLTAGVAIFKILQTLGENLGWNIVEFWNMKEQRNCLYCQEIWHEKPISQEFHTTTQELNFAPGVGLPGRIWASGMPA